MAEDGAPPRPVAPPPVRLLGGLRVVTVAGVAAVVAGGVVAGLVAWFSAPSGTAGLRAHFGPAALAAVLVALIFVAGTAMVNVAAAALPQASLLIALLTLMLQLVAVLAVMTALVESPWVGDDSGRRAVGLAVLSVAVMWTISLVVGTLVRGVREGDPAPGPEGVDGCLDQGAADMRSGSGDC